MSPRLPVARIVLLIGIGLNLFDHAGYLLSARQSPQGVDWVATYQQVDTTLEWMKAHLDRDAVVAATNPALVHLRTGHKTITLDRVTEPWSVWRSRRARYAACLVARDLPSGSRGPYKLLYQSHPGSKTSYWVVDLY